MNRNAVGWVIALTIGALLGVGVTLWFFAQATHHVSNLQTPDVPLPGDVPTVPDRIRIMELVCRDMLSASNIAADGVAKVPSVCYVGVGDGQDPAPELLAALSDLPMSVQRYSAGSLEGGGIKDKKTGVPTLTITIQRMSMGTRNEVHVQVRLDTGDGRVPRDWIYTVARADGQWRLTGRERSK